MADRWVLKRSLTGVTLHRDAPVQITDGHTRELSGAGSLRFTMPSAFASLIAEADGLPIVEKWNTRLYRITDDGTIVWGGVITRAQDGTRTWSLEASTDSIVLFGTPYLGPDRYLAQIDPADIVRTLVDHLQGQPDSSWGITVRGSTPRRIGSFSEQDAKDAAAAYEDAKSAYSAAIAERKRLAAIVAASRVTYSGIVQRSTAANAALSDAKRSKDAARIAQAQAAVNAVTAEKSAQNALIDQQQGDVDAQAARVARAKSAKDAAYTTKVNANKLKKDDGGAYQLLWREAPDCGERLQSLAGDIPFDYLDSWELGADGDTVRSYLDVIYPRAGRRRTDIAFEHGVNIVDVLESTDDGDEYASEVVGIGAGEGAKAIRRSAAIRNKRPRRVVVVEDRTIKTATAMDRRINRELATRQKVLEVQQLRVRRMPGASWDLGDDVPVRAVLRGAGAIDVYHRIVAEQPVNDTIVDLTLRRSDSFIYGA